MNSMISLFLLMIATTTMAQKLQWNQTLHYSMLQYAAAAYCPEDRVIAWQCSHCINTVNVTATFNDAPTNTFGYAGLDFENNQIIVVFRGTEPTSLKNWITDLSTATMVDYEFGTNARVHDGFLNAYESIKEQVQDALYPLIGENPTLPIFFIGHSLGAALAELAAIDFSITMNSDNMIFGSYNYGAPRVGNSGYAQVFMQEVENNFRVVNERDIVPHVPPQFLTFVHPTREVWYNNNKFNLCSQTNSEDKSCSDSIIPDLITGIADHITYQGVQLGWGEC